MRDPTIEGEAIGQGERRVKGNPPVRVRAVGGVPAERDRAVLENAMRCEDRQPFRNARPPPVSHRRCIEMAQTGPSRQLHCLIDTEGVARIASHLLQPDNIRRDRPDEPRDPLPSRRPPAPVVPDIQRQHRYSHTGSLTTETQRIQRKGGGKEKERTGVNPRSYALQQGKPSGSRLSSLPFDWRGRLESLLPPEKIFDCVSPKPFFPLSPPFFAPFVPSRFNSRFPFVRPGSTRRRGGDTSRRSGH